MDQESERLATIAMFLFGGTPILTDYRGLDKNTTELLKQLSTMRSYQGIKLGSVNVANTTDQVIAFTRYALQCVLVVLKFALLINRDLTF